MPKTRPIHRQAFACALACLLLSITAVAAPASQDLRAPDARDAALAQERYYSSYAGQDLRSPDARDAGRIVETTPASPPVSAVEPVGSDGIAPLAFVVALFGALIAGAGATTGVHALRGRRRAARTA